MDDIQVFTGQIKARFELTASVGQHPFDRPARFLEGYGEVPKELPCLSGIVGWQDPGDRIRAGGVASCDLPDFSDAFKLSDVESVQTDQVAWMLALHVSALATCLLQ